MKKIRRPWLLAAGCLLAAIWLVQAEATEPIDSFAQCQATGYLVTDSNPPVCSTGSHTFTGPATATEPTPPPASLQAFSLLASADGNVEYPASQIVIHTATEWEQYWRQIHSGLTPVPPLPPVDFSWADVVAITTGKQMTGGYSLRVTSIMTGAGGSVVNATQTVPTTTCTVSMGSTNRYTVVRTAKLAEPVSFRLTTDYHRC
jgi:hypothetical protein